VILAIDQGTTGTTCLVFDTDGELLARAYREFTQHFPRPGWVEHDAREIWEVTQAVAGEAPDEAGCAVGELAAVGVTAGGSGSGRSRGRGRDLRHRRRRPVAARRAGDHRGGRRD